MSKVRYSATFTLPDGGEFVLTRGSREDYGYTFAWILLAGDGDRLERGAILAKGFSRTRQNAEQAANAGVKYASDRTALVAPVTKEGARMARTFDVGGRVKFSCADCGFSTEWLPAFKGKVGRRGLPCPRCNPGEDGGAS
jgi:hypothetical protein